MNRIRTAVAALALLGAASASWAQEAPAAEAPAGEGIEWVRDWAAARDQAAKEKKGLFVYLTPDWFT